MVNLKDLLSENSMENLTASQAVEGSVFRMHLGTDEGVKGKILEIMAEISIKNLSAHRCELRCAMGIIDMRQYRDCNLSSLGFRVNVFILLT